MGTGLRVFLVKDDDSIEHFPLARYERLLQRHPDERLQDIYRKARDAVSDLCQEAGKLEHGLEPNGS